MSKTISLKAEGLQVRESWDPQVLYLLKEIYLIYKTKHIETVAIHNMNLTINANEYLAILGPSGSGKTSLLKILTGVLPCTTGRIYFKINDGHITNLARYDYSQLTEFRRKYIGYIPQLPIYFENLTVEDNLKVPLIIKHQNSEDVEKRIEDTLALCNIEHRREYTLDNLSGGEQQRVQVAMAIVSNPRILIADEPTANLDSENAFHIFELFQTIRKEQQTTVLVVTHDERILKYADRSLNLVDGAIN
ncbi:MAG: ABC transporter ATP-binding protein [Promethearchaeota archaeon]